MTIEYTNQCVSSSSIINYQIIEGMRNLLSTTVGNNCVTSGLEISNIILSSNIINFDINAGSIVCDGVIFSFETFHSEIDITKYLNTGTLLIVVEYNYVRSPSFENNAKIIIKHLDSDNNTEYWSDHLHKLIISSLIFDKANHIVTINESNILNEISIQVNHLNYIIKPFNNTIKTLRPIR